MVSEWDAAGYVSSSKYRRDVIAHLDEQGSAMPSEIAEATGYALPHVSRALSQLREEGLIELLVPEERRRGRLYGLTPQGATVFERLVREDRGRAYEIVPVEEFDHQELIEYLEDEVGSGLRAVSRVHDESVEITFLSPTVRDRYDGRLVEDLLVDLDMLWRRAGSADLHEIIGSHRYIVHVFDRAVLFCLFLPDENVVVSAEPGIAVPVDVFAETCLARLDA